MKKCIAAVICAVAVFQMGISAAALPVDAEGPDYQIQCMEMRRGCHSSGRRTRGNGCHQSEGHRQEHHGVCREEACPEREEYCQEHHGVCREEVRTEREESCCGKEAGEHCCEVLYQIPGENVQLRCHWRIPSVCDSMCFGGHGIR